MKITLTKDKV